MPKISRRTIGDLALCACVIAGSAILFIGASTLPPPRFEPLGSAAVPRILGVILIVLSLIVAVQSLLTRDAVPEAPAALPYRGFLVLAALVAYVAALDHFRVPFLIATPVFVLASGVAMSRPTLRNSLFFAALGLAVAAVLYWVLSTFLYIRIG